MTTRLYYTDSYLREFDADVVDRSDGGRRIYLDRTAFYPTSGGQASDRGTLGQADIVDVVDEGERIAHLVSLPLTDARVSGRIDWNRRFDHMQQHTGQHLLSAVLADLFRYATVGVHFGAESSSLDLDLGAISHEEVVAAERRANEIVAENRRVEVTFEDAGRVSGLRKAPERQGALRIVTIEDLDRNACGGTHVQATGEIGPILIRKVERVKQLARVEFLCGGRAVRRARIEGDLLARMAVSFSATPEELPTLAEAQRADLKQLASERKELEERLCVYRADELYRAAAPDSSGRRIVLIREQQGPVDRLRVLSQAVAKLPGAVFIATVSDPPAVLLATAADSGIDAGRALRSALERVAGRGGGNQRVAQGSVPSAEGLELVVRTIAGGG